MLMKQTVQRFQTTELCTILEREENGAANDRRTQKDNWIRKIERKNRMIKAKRIAECTRPAGE